MAKKPTCVDTDICLDFLRKKEPGLSLLTKLIDHYEPCITAMTVFELYFGQEKMSKKVSIDGFIVQFVFLPFDLKAAKVSAEIQASLDKEGKSIGLPDTFIAGICIANNIPLLTLNARHFSRVTELKLLSIDM